MYPFGTNEKSDFYELRQQQKQLKTMEMSKAWPDIFYEGYIHQFQPESLTKLTSRRRSTEFKDILPWNISQMIKKTIPISTRIVISYPTKWDIPLRIWWKVNGKWDNNMISEFPNGRKVLLEQILVSEEINKPKRITVRDLSRKVIHLSRSLEIEKL